MIGDWELASFVAYSRVICKSDSTAGSTNACSTTWSIYFYFPHHSTVFHCLNDRLNTYSIQNNMHGRTPEAEPNQALHSPPTDWPPYSPMAYAVIRSTWDALYSSRDWLWFRQALPGSANGAWWLTAQCERACREIHLAAVGVFSSRCLSNPSSMLSAQI